jgi:hypothetical protein
MSVEPGEAEKLEMVRAGFTFSDRVMFADPPDESLKKARTAKVPAEVGMHTKDALSEEAHPGRPVYEYDSGAVPPEVTTVRVDPTPTSTVSGEAVKDVIEGAGVTVKVSVLLADRPRESFTKTRTVKVPAVVGTHFRVVLLADAHPGRPVYEYEYGAVPPEVTTVRVDRTPTSTWLGAAVKDVTEGAGATVNVRVLVADWPRESFTKTRTVKVPETVGTHVRVVLLADAHPGSPV